MPVFELDPVGESSPLLFLQQKYKNGVANGDLVPVPQPLLPHGQAVHQSAVAAVHIPDLKPAVIFPP